MNSEVIWERRGCVAAGRLAKRACAARWLVLLLWFLGDTGIGMATIIPQVTMKDMLKGSELVFEGQVVNIESRFSPDGNNIFTHVTFKVSGVIKGDFTEDTLQLSFLGGTVGKLTLSISDMHMPELLEKGIYFVESLKRQQIHPLYGWDQGHFVIERDQEGIERVLTRTRKKVVGLDAGQLAKAGNFSGGVALGVRVAEESSQKSLTISEFKQRLRDLMGAAQ